MLYSFPNSQSTDTSKGVKIPYTFNIQIFLKDELTVSEARYGEPEQEYYISQNLISLPSLRHCLNSATAVNSASEEELTAVSTES